MTIELQPGEISRDTRRASYHSPGGKKFNGKMIITNKRILCDVPFDLAAKGQMSENMFIRWGSRGFIEMNRDEISEIKFKKGFLNQVMTIILRDGSIHFFLTGIWGGNKLSRAMAMDLKKEALSV